MEPRRGGQTAAQEQAEGATMNGNARDLILFARMIAEKAWEAMSSAMRAIGV